MNIERLDKQREWWQAWFYVYVGATITLLALALTNNPNQGILRSNNWNWYLIWVVVHLGGAPLAIRLVFGQDWRQLGFTQRLDTIYGYLATEWVSFLALFIKYQSDEGDLLAIWPGLLLVFGFIAATVATGLSYWFLRRTHVNSSEEMFP